MTGTSVAVASSVNEEYRLLSRFVGDLLRKGLLSQAEAQVMLVEGFWDCERKAAASQGLDLDSQVAELANSSA